MNFTGIFAVARPGEAVAVAGSDRGRSKAVAGRDRSNLT